MGAGCTPALSMTQKRRCSFGMRLVALCKCYMPSPLLWQKRTRRNDEDEVEDDIESTFYEPKLVFSHDDIVNNRVAYTPDPSAPRADDEAPLTDGFNYTLRAPHTQPAVGSLYFEVVLPPLTTSAPESVNDEDDEDEYYYVYVDDVEEEEGDNSMYVTTALIVAGGALTSICSIVSYRCYRLSRRRRLKRRQRELEGLSPKPELVDRHAADLHPSDPLLTRSTWTEPMRVAASEAELQRMRAEQWQRRRRVNDALRCAGVESGGDDRPPGDDDQTLFPRSQSGPGSPRQKESSWFDPVKSLPRSTTDDRPRNDPRGVGTGVKPYPLDDDQVERRTLEQQQGRVPEPTGPRSDAAAKFPPDPQPNSLLSWLDRPSQEAAPSRSNPSIAQPHAAAPGDNADVDARSQPASVRQPYRPFTYLGNPRDIERYSNDRKSSAGLRQAAPAEHSSTAFPDHAAAGPPGQLRSPVPTDVRERLNTDQPDKNACADGSHCDPVHQGDVVTLSETAPFDDDGVYVTGSRPHCQPYSSDHDAAAPVHQVVFDWDNVDPQLLDLCRKTSPVLDKNQYWV